MLAAERPDRGIPIYRTVDDAMDALEASAVPPNSPRLSVVEPRRGSRGCRWSCRGCWRCGPRRGSGGSTRRDRGRSRRASPVRARCRSGGVEAGAVGSRWDRTSPRTIPTRCRSCCIGRSRWAGRVDRRGAGEAVGRGVVVGNVPWKTFIRCSPSGSRSSPHGNPAARDRRGRRTPTRPRSAGGCPPTRSRPGRRSRTRGSPVIGPPASEECGPSGWRQSAPCTCRHHGASRRRGSGEVVG